MLNKKLKIESGKWKVSLKLSNNFQLSTLPSTQLRASNSQLKSGFSFVELLVVIAILGLLLTITFASFSNFQKSTKLTNAALQLKSDLRYAQNKALAGDKSTTNCSVAGNTLVGWYLEINNNSNSYLINGICKNNLGFEVPETLAYKTPSLPNGVTATNDEGGDIRVLFKTIEREVSIHDVSAAPYFYDASGSIQNLVSSPFPFKITLTSTSGSYQVVIQPSGEISEKKL